MSSFDPESPAPQESAQGVQSTPPSEKPTAATTVDKTVGARLDGIETLMRQFGGEWLRERRTARRWRLGMRLAWFGLVLVVVWVGFTHGSRTATGPTGAHTALIEVRGEISADSEASAENIISSLRSAYDDQNAKAIVLRFNSPGGSPVQAGIVNDEIRRLRKLHPNKKVYAVCEEMCASAAYYMAVAADDIYVDKASIVGSIGVLMDGFGFTGLMDKLGVERRLLTSGSNKGMLDPFSPVNEKQQAYAQAMLDQIHEQFIQVVREGRGKRLKEEPDTFSGLFWNGQQAVDNGLADHLGSLDYVAREVVHAQDVVDYSAQENVAERLAKRFGASIGAGAVGALREITPIR
jgi:protease IV